jgi:hypothetical protein
MSKLGVQGREVAAKRRYMKRVVADGELSV